MTCTWFGYVDIYVYILYVCVCICIYIVGQTASGHGWIIRLVPDIYIWAGKSRDDVFHIPSCSFHPPLACACVCVCGCCPHFSNQHNAISPIIKAPRDHQNRRFPTTTTTTTTTITNQQQVEVMHMTHKLGTDSRFVRGLVSK